MVKKTNVLLDDTTMYGKALVCKLKNKTSIALMLTPFSLQNIIEIINSKKPEIIIIDADIVFTEAVELVTLIKATRPTIEVYSLSLWDMNINKQDMIAAGADLHLSKIDEIECLMKALKDNTTPK